MPPKRQELPAANRKKTLYLLHQTRSHSRFFHKPENVVAACFGAIRADLGEDHKDNKNRRRALERLLELSVGDVGDNVSLGGAGYVFVIEADERALETMPEDAPSP